MNPIYYIHHYLLRRKIKRYEYYNSMMENKYKDHLIFDELRRHKRELDNVERYAKSMQVKIQAKKTPIIQKIKNLFARGSKFLIHMHHENGSVDTFVMKCRERFFWKKGVYVVDESQKRWNASSKLYELHYHIGCSIPFALVFDPVNAKQHIKNIESVDLAINPETLEIYIHSQFIQKIMQGADMEKLFGFLKIAAVINIIIGLICMGILIKLVS